ncbi:aspartate aminotransferase family protein [Gulosibacter chungangensis]|uniref:Aspartate aminotransferase family protein n=1 Tax=Gulosibacter chungangensis TaxID=979746 RepID=A0A7J5BAI5_9MICO|nr:aspartate aminotransferase family protein [Gulosibacter chungangensis]KAB1642259.1 aspartate aminotransferase family protein [Gulosibacter chungangensis]
MSATASTHASNAEVIAHDVDHVFHSWSAQAKLSPIAIRRGNGCTVEDFEGREYLDLSSMLVNVNIGHQHPRVIEAIQRQAAELATVAPANANPARARAAELILSHAPEGFNKVFFTNGGADANENAIRLARLHTGRDKVLSQYRSYHGNTGAAIVATGDWRRVPNEYATGHVHFFGPYAYRSEFWSSDEQQEGERALQHLERVIQSEGPESIAAILLETIPGTAGIIVPPAAYLPGVRALADKYGIMLILDEVMAGFGRAGEWFAFDAFDVKPDLITFAKGVNSGYVPLGGVVISEEIAAQFDERVFPGGLTYSGHPLACASAVASMEAMADEGIIENAHRVGAEVIGPGLRELAERFEVIGEVRGLGVFWAVEFVADAQTREPISEEFMGQLKNAMLERGALPFTSANRLHFVPPCVITDEEARRGLRTLADALAAVAAG